MYPYLVTSNMYFSLIWFYLKPTEACQTKANKRKRTGITGITSTIGRNTVYGSGRAANKKLIPILRYLFKIKKTLTRLYNKLFKELVKFSLKSVIKYL